MSAEAASKDSAATVEKPKEAVEQKKAEEAPKLEVKTEEKKEEPAKSPVPAVSPQPAKSPAPAVSPQPAKSPAPAASPQPPAASPAAVTSPQPPAAATPDAKVKEAAKEVETNGETASPAPKLPTLREQFKAFSKFGDSKSDGKLLTLSQSDKWMKQAKIIAPKSVITTTDTAIHFKKFKAMKIVFADYDKYLTDLAKTRNQDLAEIKGKLKGCGAPGTTGTTAVAKNSAVDRLTDTKKFTGSHKMRGDTPKGKASPFPRK